MTRSRRRLRPPARAYPRAAVVAVAVAALAAATACGPSPAAPTPAGCLVRAAFGPAAQSPYVLPYPVGTAYSVLQSYCDATSHGNQLAYDFLMPQGSPVTAARAGEVVEVVDRWPDSDWTAAHFNYVFVRHDDGSVAFYAHFQLHSIQVHVRDRVVAGQQLGSSGHSGTTVADLHFGVYQSWPVANGADLPVNFRNAQGTLDSRGGLQRGATYTALVY